jgi:hypothetical protein
MDFVQELVSKLGQMMCKNVTKKCIKCQQALPSADYCGL